MEIKYFNGTTYEDNNVDDDANYAFGISLVGKDGKPPEADSTKQTHVEVVLNGKEIKSIIELVNTFTKLQGSPLTGNLFNVLQKIEGFKNTKGGNE